MKHIRRNLKECPGCSFTYNESELSSTINDQKALENEHDYKCHANIVGLLKPYGGFLLEKSLFTCIIYIWSQSCLQCFSCVTSWTIVMQVWTCASMRFKNTSFNFALLLQCHYLSLTPSVLIHFHCIKKSSQDISCCVSTDKIKLSLAWHKELFLQFMSTMCCIWCVYQILWRLRMYFYDLVQTYLSLDFQ